MLQGLADLSRLILPPRASLTMYGLFPYQMLHNISLKRFLIKGGEQMWNIPKSTAGLAVCLWIVFNHNRRALVTLNTLLNLNGMSSSCCLPFYSIKTRAVSHSDL